MGELKDIARRFVSSFDNARLLSEREIRIGKARMIRAVLHDSGGLEGEPVMLDVGCSYGFILEELTREHGFGVGIDLDNAALLSATKLDRVGYVLGDGEVLPFADEVFDVVICNHVYEHTDQPEILLAEIHRVMKFGGLCYLSGPNRYSMIEPHYNLPLLGWFSESINDRYLRLSGKGDRYDVKPYSLAGLRRLCASFHLEDYTARILIDPEKFQAVSILPRRSIARWAALAVYYLARRFFPGAIFVLKKPVV